MWWRWWLRLLSDVHEDWTAWFGRRKRGIGDKESLDEMVNADVQTWCRAPGARCQVPVGVAVAAQVLGAYLRMLRTKAELAFRERPKT